MKQTFHNDFLRLLSILLLAAGVFGIAGQAQAAPAAVWYVCPAGDCGNPGASFNALQPAINAAADGDTIYIQPGVYPGAVDLIGRTLTLEGTGASRADVVLDGRSVADWSVYALNSTLTLRNLTVLGSASAYYGVKIEAGSGALLENISVQGSGRSNIDFNGGANITVRGVEAAGAASGVGIAFTDCSHVLVENLVTSGNAWGGMAVYTYGRYYPGGSEDITLAGANTLAEANPLYVEVGNFSDPAHPYPVTNFTAGGFAYTVGNHLQPAYTWYRADLPAALTTALAGGAQSYIRSLAQPGLLIVQNGMTIQAAIDAAAVGETVHIYPGDYSETAANRRLFNGSGPYQFGLFIGVGKDHLTLQGVDGNGVPITDYHNAAAGIRTNATNSFGYSGVFVEADHVTIAGIRLLPNTAGENKSMEIIGDGFTLQHSMIDIEYGNVYFGDWRFDEATNTSHIQSYYVLNNYFAKGAALSLVNGAGYSGEVGGRVIAGNLFENNTYYASISFSGTVAVIPWFKYPVSGAVITGNSFTGGTFLYIRTRGEMNDASFDWASYWNDNTYDKAVMAGPNPPVDPRAWSYTASGYGVITNVRSIGPVIQSEVEHALAGDTVLVRAGTYSEAVSVGKALILTGENRDTTVVNGGFHLLANDITVQNFTILNGAAFWGERAGVFVTKDNAILRNNLLIGAGKTTVARGILTGYNVHNLLVEENAIRSWMSGMYLNPTAGPTLVQRNILTGNSAGMGTDGQANLTITQNYFIENDGAVGGSSVAENFIVSGNAFLNNFSGAVTQYSGQPISATLNWWGSLSGPSAASNPGGSGQNATGSLTFSPWLCSGEDTDPLLMGFQPGGAPYCTAAPTRLVFRQQPTVGYADTPFNPQPVVQAEDDAGNVGVNFNELVLLYIGYNPTGGVLVGHSVMQAVNGVAAYTDLYINKEGSGYTLVAFTYSGLRYAVSQPFDVLPPAADLALTVTGTPNPVTAAQPLVYTLAVSNTGPSAAQAVQVSLTLPTGAALQDASGEGWLCSAMGSVVTCTRSSLAAGTSAPGLVIRVTAPEAPGNITAAGAVSSATGDPDETNNNDTETVLVIEIPVTGGVWIYLPWLFNLGAP